MAALNAMSLFTGAGGLDLGLQAAGFHIAGCVERDEDCRKTLANIGWTLAKERDIEAIEPRKLLEELGLQSGGVTLLAGGPPCQPFSKSGQWRTGAALGLADPRARTLHGYFDIVDAALPRVMLLENVKGLVAEPREGSTEERARELLHDALDAINARHGTCYAASIIHLDAAKFGVAQKRERVFVVAERDGRRLSVPQATHGGPDQPRIATAWDAIGDLNDAPWDPALAVSGAWAGLLPSIPEGRNYLHHTRKGDGLRLFGWRRKYWSFLLKLAKDRPSWTITAQPGSATGPFHWANRRLSGRELARLQTFPDDHEFKGTYHSVRRQVGNAVPVALGEVLGLEIRRQLLDDDPKRGVSTIPAPRDDCPPAEEPTEVPEEYLSLVGEHDDHPGPGLGNGALKREAELGAAPTS